MPLDTQDLQPKEAFLTSEFGGIKNANDLTLKPTVLIPTLASNIPYIAFYIFPYLIFNFINYLFIYFMQDPC